MVTACEGQRAPRRLSSTQPSPQKLGAAISFLSPEHGFLVTIEGRDRGVLRRTADAGRTWQVISIGLRAHALRFVTARRGYALDEHSRLLRTTDGGHSWSLLPVGAIGSFAFPDRRHGWAAAGDRLLTTADGGQTWRRVADPCSRTTPYIGGLSFMDARRGYVACGGQPATIMQAKKVYASADGGRSWHVRACVDLQHRAACPGRLDAVGHVSSLDFRSVPSGLLLTSRGGIARTGDAGAHWTETLATDDRDTVMATSWASSNTVYALLYHGAKLLRSEDGGRHWRPV